MPDNYITLNQLTKATKGLVNKINAESTITNSKIGDLADLNTTTKTDLVAAINEVAAGETQYDDTALAGRVTALENAGYITSYTETDPIFTTSAAAGISSTDITNWNAKSDFSGSYEDLEDKPTIPNVPNWALAASKPTYTAAEVGALPSTYTAPVTSVNGQTGEVNLTIPAAQVQSDWNATSGMGVILNKPTIPAATTVTNTLASGTLIATINGTNIYAPAYTDADGVSY